MKKRHDDYMSHGVLYLVYTETVFQLALNACLYAIPHGSRYVNDHITSSINDVNWLL